MTCLRKFSEGWKRGIARGGDHPRAGGKKGNRGIALVVTLLLLFLLSVLGLAAVLSTSSDIMINGYYGNSRAAFYAADAGLNIARQAMQTEVNSLVPTTWNTAAWTSCTPGTASGPLSTTTSANSMLNAITQYANTTYLAGPRLTTNAGAAAQSWGESFTITNTGATTPPLIQLAANSPTVTCLSSFPTQFTYEYDYTITSVGAAAGAETATVTENGVFYVNIVAPPAVVPENYSFSSFGAYIGTSPPCQSSSYVAGTITGPTFVDSTHGCSGSATHCGSWNFGTSGTYIFTDPVNQTGPYFSYNISGCNLSAASSFKQGSTTIAPTFESGYNLSQTPISLPANDYSQRWAVLDGKGCGEGGTTCGAIPIVLPPVPTAQQMNSFNLSNVNQNTGTTPTLYATVSGSNYTPATMGVFMPFTCPTSSSCSLTSSAGGIWVEGSGSGVTTTVSFSTTNGSGGTSNPSGQVITVAQTKSGTTTTTTITIDPVANTTTVKTVSGSTTHNLTLSGVPEDLDNLGQSSLYFPSTSIPAATEVYVNGNVSISGPSSGAAIQNNTQLSLTANGNITQTNNITYATEPVTTSSPIDGLIVANENMNQVLGLYTAVGQFQLSPSSNNANMETDAVVAMIDPSPTGCNSSGTNCSNGDIATPGNSVKTWTLIGGKSESAVNGVNMSASNIYYDQRFKVRQNFAPPWFPQTTIIPADITGQTSTAPVTYITQQRVQWVNKYGGQ